MNILEWLKNLENEQSFGVRFVDDAGKIKRISYGDLILEARKFAGGLQTARVKAGEPVILALTNPEAAIIAILGCMIAGCPPTPIYPPLRLTAVPAFLTFVKHVAERSNARLVIGNQQPYSFLGSL